MAFATARRRLSGRGDAGSKKNNVVDCLLRRVTSERIPEFGMHEKAYDYMKILFDTAEKGPFKVAPLLAAQVREGVCGESTHTHGVSTVMP